MGSGRATEHAPVETRDDAMRERFDAWVRPHLAVMAALAARLTGNADRDDVVQDALVRAWRRWSTYDPAKGAPRAWLLAIVSGEARRRRGFRAPALSVPETTAGFTPDVDLERAIHALPRRMRLAVELHYFCDLPLSEVAAVLGVSPGTVKSSLYDARRKLAAALEVRE